MLHMHAMQAAAFEHWHFLYSRSSTGFNGFSMPKPLVLNDLTERIDISTPDASPQEEKEGLLQQLQLNSLAHAFKNS